MSENKIPLKLKIRGTFFSDILCSEVNWASYSVFVNTHGALTLLGTVLQLYIYIQPLYQFVYTCTRLCTLQYPHCHRILGVHTLCLKPFYSCTINPASVPVCVHMYKSALPQYRFGVPQLMLTNESTRRTCMNRVDQSELLKFPRTTDRQTTDRHTYILQIDY